MAHDWWYQTPAHPTEWIWGRLGKKPVSRPPHLPQPRPHLTTFRPTSHPSILPTRRQYPGARVGAYRMIQDTYFAASMFRVRRSITCQKPACEEHYPQGNRIGAGAKQEKSNPRTLSKTGHHGGPLVPQPFLPTRSAPVQEAVHGLSTVLCRSYRRAISLLCIGRMAGRDQQKKKRDPACARAVPAHSRCVREAGTATQKTNALQERQLRSSQKSVGRSSCSRVDGLRFRRPDRSNPRTKAICDRRRLL
jgi:hypothetical protein